MFCCIFGGFFIGIWLDKLFQKEYVFLIAFILIGIFSGFYQCYRLISKELNL
ncbi:AtpZ/AtpI family protein [bacterium]|nr:AtpZ/AtpI family protein [bacterium]